MSFKVHQQEEPKGADGDHREEISLGDVPALDRDGSDEGRQTQDREHVEDVPGAVDLVELIVNGDVEEPYIIYTSTNR